MKKTNLTFSAMVIAIVMIGSLNSYSQDWPQFRGIGRDSKVTGFKAPSAWPTELKLEWKVSVGFGDATPVLTGKKIYLNTRQGNEEVVLCIDASTGKELWKNQYPSVAVTGPAVSHPGPRSTPAVANGKVVTFGTSAILSCLDAKTGKVIWRRENPTNVVPQFFTGMSPLIVENLCIAHVGTKDNGEVLALDLNTGSEKWKWAGDGPAYASPSVMTVEGKKLLIVQTEKNLMALNLADGKLLWQIATPVQQRFYNASSPYIDGQTIYYTGQGTGMKAIKVEKSGNEYATKELWSATEVGAKWNTPVLKDGFLYGFSDQKRLYCVNAATGQTAWIDNAVNSDFATIVDCGSVIIGLPQTANLIVFKPEPKSYSEVAKYKVSETPIYSFPVVAGNFIYIKDAETLMLYKIN
ncbi:MAG: PQQ-like beta-propeller repeat protein [Bacteroidia bacterium]|nr:PQQ-like beta-propeller repeat protein [Bacteroidia bacterium]